jgi:hypothetical protein
MADPSTSAPPATPFVAVPDRPKRYSMSLLRAGTECMLQVKLRAEVGDYSGPFAVFGRLFHEVAAAIAFACQMRGEDTIDPDAAEGIARTIMLRPHEPEPITPAQHKLLLHMVRRWASTVTFDVHADVMEVEGSYRDQLPGTDRILSARIDYLAIRENVAVLEDYKTGPRVATQQQVEEGLQGAQYAWHVWQRFPHVDTFIFTERNVRWGTPRTVYYELGDVLDTEDYLRVLVARMDEAYASGTFDPTPGTWCNVCPAPERCPIPERNLPAFIASEDRAKAEADALLVERARVAKREAAIKAYLDATERDAIITAGGMRLGWQQPEKSTTLDKAALARDGIDLDAYRVENPDPDPKWSVRKARKDELPTEDPS